MNLARIPLAVLLAILAATSSADELRLVNGKTLAYKSLSMRKQKLYVTTDYGAKMVSWAEVDPASLPADVVGKIRTYVKNSYTYANQQYDAGAYEKATFAYRFVLAHCRYIEKAEFETMLANDIKKKSQGMYELDGEWTSIGKQKAIFENEQRKKGLVKVGSQWMTPAEKKLWDAKKAVLDIIRLKSIANADYQVLQALEDGSLCVLPEAGQSMTQDYYGTTFFLVGATQDVFADDEKFKGDLYWAGTFTYTTVKGVTRTVNAYAVDHATAFKSAAQKMGVIGGGK